MQTLNPGIMAQTGVQCRPSAKKKQWQKPTSKLHDSDQASSDPSRGGCESEGTWGGSGFHFGSEPLLCSSLCRGCRWDRAPEENYTCASSWYLSTGRAHPAKRCCRA